MLPKSAVTTVVRLLVCTCLCSSACDSGASSGSCPADPEGARHGSCSLAEGSECHYFCQLAGKPCGAQRSVCRSGEWVVTNACECAPPAPDLGTHTCPSTREEASYGSCSLPEGTKCSYGCGGCGLGQLSECRNGKWVILAGCECRADSGRPDVPSDVVRDLSRDAAGH